ncbi:LysR family transcriptional regulator [Enterobacter ludwigii]|nr:LysR family transcriptional regulator [Enterobacter ludwigii]
MDLLTAMRIFIRVVERGSMSAAARDLGIGQPAVSERIERLEAHLNTRLLRRHTRRMSLTNSGTLFYERSKSAVAAADHALAIADNGEAISGTLRIAAPYGAGEELLMPALLKLQLAYPGINIDLVLSDRVTDPVTEGVDISLRLGEAGEGYYVARPLGKIERLLVASPEYLQRYDMPRTPGELARHAFARVSGLFMNNHVTLIAPDNALLTVPVRITFTSSHWRPLRTVLLAGRAIGVLQSPVCRQEIADGHLVPVLPDYIVPSFPAYLLYPPANIISAETRACVAFLENELRTSLTRSVTKGQP